MNDRMRVLVLKRDRYRCTDCDRHKDDDDVEALDVHHKVPRGAGGSHRVSNLTTLCRRCHDAIHNGATAPAIRWETTGDLEEYEYRWFKQYVMEMIPALGELVDVHVEARYGPNALPDSRKAWYIPLGDLRKLHDVLKTEDDDYNPSPPSHFM